MINETGFRRIRVSAWILVIAALVGGMCGPTVSLSAGADSKTAARDTLPRATRDFGAGFAQFVALGLPDISTGRWVSVDLDDYGPYEALWDLDHMISYSTEGNAWLLDRNTNGHYRVVTPLGGQFWFDGPVGTDEKVLIKAYAQSRSLDDTPGLAGVARGRAMLIDLDEDMRKFREQLAEGLDEMDEEDVEMMDEDELAEAGSALISLALLYQAGFTNEANVVVGMMFDLFGSPQTLLKGAVATLGTVKAEEAMAQFRVSGEWQAFHDRLKLLRKRYGASWEGATRIEAMMKAVVWRIAHPEPPAIKAEGLTDVDQALARELALPSTPPQLPQRLPPARSRGHAARRSHVYVPTRDTSVEPCRVQQSRHATMMPDRLTPSPRSSTR